jgi:N-acetylglucosamine repressor
MASLQIEPDIVSPIQTKLLRQLNERLVLRVIQEEGPATRAEVTKRIGVTFPTVAKAVTALLESRLLEENEDAGTGRGRPAKRLRLATSTAQVVGIAVDVETCTIAAAGFDGAKRPDSVASFPTPATYPDLVKTIAARIKFLSDDKRRTTHGVGISLPGLVDYSNQRVLFSANLGFLNNMPLNSDISKATGLDCTMVRASHSLCLSERLHRGAKQINNFIILDLCSGLGLGVMINGRLLAGQTGFAGEIGHSSFATSREKCHCGKRGCLETVASEWALTERVSKRLGRMVDIEEIIALVRSGDKVARSEVHRLCKYLAIGLSHAINMINPGHAFVYGRVFAAFPELLDTLIRHTKRLTIRQAFDQCQILAAETTPLEGAIASVVSFLTDSRGPDLDMSLTLLPAVAN